MANNAKSYRRIEAVRKTLEILNYLGDQSEPVTPDEIASALDMPLGTVLSHLATLVDAQYAEHSYGAYELGMRIGIMWRKLLDKKNAQKGRIVKKINALEGGK